MSYKWILIVGLFAGLSGCALPVLPVMPGSKQDGAQEEAQDLAPGASTDGAATQDATPEAAQPATPDGVLELSTKNVSVARSDIKIWNVEPTSAVRQGSSTSNESGTVNVEWSDGSTTSHDATYKSTSVTLFQDGKVCHNYGPSCYCATTTFRLESGAKLWKFGTPSNNTAVACPSGVQPTGDAAIRKSSTPSRAEVDAARARAHHKQSSGKKKGH